MLKAILKNQNEFMDIDSVLKGYFIERVSYLLEEKPKKVTIKTEDNLFCIEMKNYVILEKSAIELDNILKLHSLFI